MTFAAQWLTSGTSTDTARSVAIALAPGLLANGSANPACLLAANTTVGGPCQIGNGTLDTTVATVDTPVPVNLFLAPAANPATQFATVDIVAPPPIGTLPAVVTATSTGSLVLTASNLPSVTGVSVTGLDFTLNATLNGQPFNRLPTSCGAATTALAVTFAGATTPFSTTGAFTPTGCSSLPFSPQLSVTATKDTSDNNVSVTTSTMQANALGQAADKTLTLTVPAGVLTPNVGNAAALLNSGKSVGTATATSPLIPLPLTGNVTLTGTALVSNLTITFPAPFPLTLQGAVSLTNNSVTFSDVPDVPLSTLSVTLTGGSSGLYETMCAPSTGTLMGNFGGWNGASFASSPMFTVANCTTAAGKPTASAALGGLVKHKPSLKFTVKEGKNAKPIKTVVVSLPSGLSFSKNAKALKKGIKVSGGTFKLSHGSLTITLKKPASAVTVTISSPAVTVSAKLANTVKTELKKHKAKPLSFKIEVIDSGKTSGTIIVRVTPKS